MSATIGTRPTGSTVTGDRPAPRLRALLGEELRDELRGLRRDPSAWFFTIAMPVGFFALFAGLFGGEATTDGGTVGTSMLGTYGAFGVMIVAAMAPGVGLSEDRHRGWLRVKRTWAVPLPVAIGGKVLFTVPMIVLVLGCMTAVAAGFGTLDVGWGPWSALVAAMVLGSLPFALLGIAVGALLNPNACVAVLNAIVLPSAVVAGLWFPLDQLPEAVQAVAHWTPAYHLGQLGLVALGGGPAAGHVLALLGWTAVTAVAAGVAYRRLRT